MWEEIWNHHYSMGTLHFALASMAWRKTGQNSKNHRVSTWNTWKFNTNKLNCKPPASPQLQYSITITFF